MRKAQSNEMQSLNLQILSIVRDGLANDRDGTRHRFQLTVEQADQIAALTYAEMQAISMHAGDLCLFIPRADLGQLLAAPAGLVSVLASVRGAGRKRGKSRTPGRRQSDYCSHSREAA